MTAMSVHNAGISEIFYYLEKHTNITNGRAVGRKIGTLQEILIRKYLMQSQQLADAIFFEPFLMGYSGTGHKVEFVFFQPLDVFELEIGHGIQIGDFALRLISCDLEKQQAAYTIRSIGSGARTTKTSIKLHYGFYIPKAVNSPISEGTLLKLSALTATHARFVSLDKSLVRASVESKRVGAQRFSDSDKLGSGIQTIEKAKQAALVAIDADLKFNGTVKALSPLKTTRNYISIAVLGNGVHWKEKDKNILRTFIDFTYLARDTSIIRYFEYVNALATEQGADFLPFFMDYFKGMTKTLPDTFVVSDSDFEIICPEGEERSLIQVLENHLSSTIL